MGYLMYSADRFNINNNSLSRVGQLFKCMYNSGLKSVLDDLLLMSKMSRFWFSGSHFLSRIASLRGEKWRNEVQKMHI